MVRSSVCVCENKNPQALRGIKDRKQGNAQMTKGHAERIVTAAKGEHDDDDGGGRENLDIIGWLCIALWRTLE